MAERRMFAKDVVTSDVFLDMPTSARALFFHLGMEADDDGFLNRPKSIIRAVGCSEDDLKLLIAKGFVIDFPSGVVVLRHWKRCNYIQKDRYKPTAAKDEVSQLRIDENNCYQLFNSVSKMDTTCIQSGHGMDTQVRLGKFSLGKFKEREGQVPTAPAPTKENSTKKQYGEYQNVLLTDKEVEKLRSEFPNIWEQSLESLSEYMESRGRLYKNHYATLRKWIREDLQKANTSQPQRMYASCGVPYSGRSAEDQALLDQLGGG